MELVTIARFRQGLDANLCRSFLESEQIPAVLANECLVGVNWLYSDAIGGVEVRVEKSKVESAISLLQSVDAHGSANADPGSVSALRMLWVMVILGVAAMAIPLLIVVISSRSRRLAKR